MKRQVIVVGAGAAGLVAAGFLAQRGANVVILEKTKRTATKVRISGKGRCNITNAMPIQDFPQNYPGNGRFLYGALHRFSNQDTLDFFASLGVQLKTERGQRVFPVSDDAHEIADALESFARKNGAKILFEHKVEKVEITDDGQVTGVTYVRQNRKGFLPAENIIIATGGKSYPGTGSTGDGYTIAAGLGHSIVTPYPALVPLRVKEKWVQELSGLSLRNVELKIDFPQGCKSYFGEMMFAHFGITGPIVLTASEHVGLAIQASNQSLMARIDLKPALTEEELDMRLLRDLDKFSRKHFANLLMGLVPKSMVSVLLALLNIPGDKPCHQITKEERLALLALLKDVPLTLVGTLPISTAIVTAGGINVKEVDPKTLESKIKKGVFFAGEVLDIHGVTGGFNLQAAFSTGYCAAQAVQLAEERL